MALASNARAARLHGVADALTSRPGAMAQSPANPASVAWHLPNLNHRGNRPCLPVLGGRCEKGRCDRCLPVLGDRCERGRCNRCLRVPGRQQPPGAHVPRCCGWHGWGRREGICLTFVRLFRRRSGRCAPRPRVARRSRPRASGPRDPSECGAPAAAARMASCLACTAAAARMASSRARTAAEARMASSLACNAAIARVAALWAVAMASLPWVSFGTRGWRELCCRPWRRRSGPLPGGSGWIAPLAP